MSDDLARFVHAQNEGGTYPRALAELRAGAKTSHWMWFVFPQLAGLGRSATARHFGIADSGEAIGYLRHALLGARLAESTAAMLGWAGRRSAEQILGQVDALKFASSMTLFAEIDAAQAPPFAAALHAFYDGQRDPLSLRLLGR